MQFIYKTMHRSTQITRAYRRADLDLRCDRKLINKKGLLITGVHRPLKMTFSGFDNFDKILLAFSQQATKCQKYDPNDEDWQQVNALHLSRGQLHIIIGSNVAPAALDICTQGGGPIVTGTEWTTDTKR